MDFDLRLVKLAEEYCDHYHGKEFRKSTNEPYTVHPREVRDTLFRFGYTDTIYQCVSLLHDTREDTLLRIPEIKKRFGYEIANGVFVLSKNTIKSNVLEGFYNLQNLDMLLSEEDVYVMRLSFARDKIKRVKIGDMINNTKDLVNLKPESIVEKIALAQNVYIPWGKEICPLMIRELENNILNYKRKTGN